MELELDRTQRSGYEAVLDTTVCREETLESIVPDACPDILRICDTEGVGATRSRVIELLNKLPYPFGVILPQPASLVTAGWEACGTTWESCEPNVAVLPG